MNIQYRPKSYEPIKTATRTYGGRAKLFLRADCVVPQGVPSEMIVEVPEEFASKAIADGAKGVKMRIELKID